MVGRDGNRGAPGVVASELPGIVVDVVAVPGRDVRAGDPVCLLESMKMEVPILAPIDGTVTAVWVGPGQRVAAGTAVAEVRSSTSPTMGRPGHGRATGEPLRGGSIGRLEHLETMARLPAAVSVVTVVDASGSPRGFTASAVTSLSLEPPLLLVCVGRSVSSHRCFRPAAEFAVSFLAAGQQGLAREFGSAGERRFDDRFDQAVGRPPVVLGSVAAARCVVESAVPSGDHSIVVGHVVGAEVRGGPPLVVHERQFCAIAPLEAPGTDRGSGG